MAADSDDHKYLQGQMKPRPAPSRVSTASSSYCILYNPKLYSPSQLLQSRHCTTSALDTLSSRTSLKMPFVNGVYMASRAHCSFGMHRCLANAAPPVLQLCVCLAITAKLAAPSPSAHTLFATIFRALLDKHDVRKARKKR